MKIRRFNEEYTEEEYLMTVEELRDIFLILIDELDKELVLSDLYVYGKNTAIEGIETNNKETLDKKFESTTISVPYNTNIFKDIEPGYKTSLDAYRRFNEKIDPIIDYIEKELLEKDYTISINQIFGDASKYINNGQNIAEFIISFEVSYIHL